MANGLGIKATEDRVDTVLTRNYRYTVPDYQRRYSWEEEQWAALWADLKAIVEEGETHFMGSIVVIERSLGLNEGNVLEIVDGQQRLATISIILALMREKYYDISSDDKADKIESAYLMQIDIDNEYRNLMLGQFDDPEFEKIIDRDYDELGDSNLGEAVDFFAKRIDCLDIVELDNLRKALTKSVTIVSIECDSEQSAFKLFETLNDRGKALSSADLMKNHTFSKAALSKDSEVYETVRDEWEKILHNIVPNVSKPSRFFRHFIMSCSKPNYDGDVSDYKLYDEYKKIIDTRLDEENISLTEYVKEIARQSEIYVKIINKEIDMYEEDANKDINSKLRDLETINSVQARTLKLRIFSEYDTANRVMEALILLESFLLRWKVASYPTGGELDRIYSRICSSAFDKDNTNRAIHNSFLDRCPSDEEVIAAIENKRVRLNDRTRYILKRLEQDYYDGGDVDLDTVDLEHIAPRASFSAKKYSAWPAYLQTTEGQFEQYRDRLGNLTLLESEKNIAIGANPFEKKKEAYRESSIDMTKQVDGDYDVWDIENIETRTSELARAMVQIWDI